MPGKPPLKVPRPKTPSRKTSVFLISLGHLFKKRRKTPSTRLSPSFKTKNRRLAPLLLAVLLIFVFSSWLFSDFFKIKKVNFLWDKFDFYDPQVEETLRQAFLEKNIFLALPQYPTIKTRLNLAVKNFTGQKEFPQTILIVISSRSPLLQIIPASPFQKEATLSALINHDGLGHKNDDQGPRLLADEELIFAQTSTPSSLPRFIWRENTLTSIGQSLSGNLTFQFFRAYQKTSEAAPPTAEITLPPVEAMMERSGDSLFLLNNSTYLIIDPHLNWTQSLRDWSLINNKYFIEGKKLKKVDLRFKNPVVEY